MKNSTITSSNRRKSIQKVFKSLFVVIFWLLIWQLISMLVGKEVIVPSPFHTFSALMSIIVTYEFYINVSSTMIRVIIGILLSFIVGTFTGVLSFMIPFLREMLRFVVIFLKSTPVMAVIIFAILWLTSSNVPIFACFIMCYPVVYTNLLTGLDNMDQNYLEMSQIYKLKTATKVRYIYLPSVLPHIKSALSLITGLSWKTVVAAEVLSSPQFSMGYNLLNAKVYLETDKLFAWIIAIVLFSYIFEKLIQKFILRGTVI